MRPIKPLLAIGFVAAAATAIPGEVEARPMGGFHAGGGRVAQFHGGTRPGWRGGGTQWHSHVRPGWRGGGTRWAGGRYYRGGYYGGGWGLPAAAAAGAAAAYGSSCYQRRWNGYTYVTVNVCR